MLAEASHGQRIARLRSSEKAWRLKAKAAAASVEGSTSAVERFADSTTAASRSLERQAKGVERLGIRQQSEAARTQESFLESNPDYGSWSPQKRDKRWKQYVRGLGSSVSLRAASRDYKAATARYKAREAQYSTLVAKQQRLYERQGRIYRRHAQAGRRLREASRVARWSP